MPKMSGNRYFAEAMRGYGVTHLFYVNSVVGAAMQEMDNVGVKRVVTHGEKAAAYMADGYARACHRPGICLSQDIGTTNLAAGLRDAHMACSPVIAITGGQNDQPRYRHAYQNAEDFSAWTGITKANYSVDTVKRFPDLLRQAFRVSTSGSPGPVHLELRGNAGQMLDGESDFDAVFEERFKHFPAFRPVAEPSAVKAAAVALAEAEKPIIVIGGGTVSSGAGAEIIKLAEMLSIPIATSLHAKALVPDDHPLNVGVPGSYSRWCANQAIAAADLVFFVGSHTGGQVTNGWQVPKIGTPVIQLDIDAEELGRNYPNTVSLHGDAKMTLQKLIEASERQQPRDKWLKEVRGYVRDYWAESEPLRNSDAVPMRPERICKELEEWLPGDATVVVDTFHAAIWTAQMTRLKAGHGYIRCGGSLGWGFPGAIGVKAALPEKPVVAFVGDAGFYYHMAELETAARVGINLVTLVNTNFSGGVLEKVAYERSVNLAKVADSMGCRGFRVEKPADIKPALDKALACGKPALVEVISDGAIRAKRGWVPPAISGE
ncbi:MAG TPA: thiamine pyrophosphate-binding protein [Burkholderiales bacterium]|jgi:acetolactate synthase-1/2/3 large subunit|nr:thiamine pyrophosphate-binding protein [Burkholderiales bacterium]